MVVIRYLFRTSLLFGLLFSVVLVGTATIQVEINGQRQSYNVRPMQMHGRTMVPLRGIFESLGAQVNWNASNRMISASRNNTNVQLGIGERRARVNGGDVGLDVPAMILRGSTMVPLRFVSEALGANVQWFEASQLVTISNGQGANISSTPRQYYTTTSNRSYANRDVYNVVAPIALYPDPMLAIILPASTYYDQVVDANRMNLYRNERAIDEQDWDVSVKALAHYPTVLRRMSDDPDWTISLGQVYVEQPQYCMDAIQGLRRQARTNYVLRSNREQRVYMDGNYVRIVPVQATMIYVPQYNPNVVYVQRRSNTNQTLLIFGIGLLIGSWLSNDTDWTHHRVYNHGWSGSGWIATSRPHVTINRLYIANRDRPAVVNRAITQRQIDRNKVRNYNLPATVVSNLRTSTRTAPRTNTTRSTNTRSMPRVQPRTTTRSTNTRSILKVQPGKVPRQNVTRSTATRKQPPMVNKGKPVKAVKRTTTQQTIKRSMPNMSMSNKKMPGKMTTGQKKSTTVKRSTPQRKMSQPAAKRTMSTTKQRQSTKMSGSKVKSSSRTTTRKSTKSSSNSKATTRGKKGK